MVHIFIDESGDSGFKKSSSRCFVVTILLTNDYKKVEKVIKKVKWNLKRKYKKVNEIHAYHAQSKTKKKILRMLSRLDDIKIFCVLLDKKSVQSDLKNKKHYIFNNALFVIFNKLQNKKFLNPHEPVSLFIDQKDTNKNINANLIIRLRKNFGKSKKSRIEINIRPSYSEKCLQAVDIISWAIFRKYERNDYGYYEIIKNKIVEEYQYTLKNRKPPALTRRHSVPQHRRD
ncbi:MAG: DUF3800 domain-containing protein [Candidatus Moraniibacteriota bacterium]